MIGSPVMNTRVDEEILRVEVKGNHGELGEQYCFRLLIEFDPLTWIERARRERRQAVVFCIGPMRIVSGGTGHEFLEKAGDIIVVGDGGREADIELTGAERREVDLAFALANGDVDIQAGLPHVLDSFQDR